MSVTPAVRCGPCLPTRRRAGKHPVVLSDDDNRTAFLRQCARTMPAHQPRRRPSRCDRRWPCATPGRCTDRCRRSDMTTKAIPRATPQPWRASPTMTSGRTRSARCGSGARCVQPRHAVVKSRAHAEVVKLVDTLASGASGGDPVEVQVLSSAPNAGRATARRLVR